MKFMRRELGYGWLKWVEYHFIWPRYHWMIGFGWDFFGTFAVRIRSAKS